MIYHRLLFVAESSGDEDCNVDSSSADEYEGDEMSDGGGHQVAMETGEEEGEMGDDRNVKTKRLNGILSKLMKDASSR